MAPNPLCARLLDRWQYDFNSNNISKNCGNNNKLIGFDIKFHKRTIRGSDGSFGLSFVHFSIKIHKIHKIQKFKNSKICEIFKNSKNL